MLAGQGPRVLIIRWDPDRCASPIWVPQIEVTAAAAGNLGRPAQVASPWAGLLIIGLGAPAPLARMGAWVPAVAGTQALARGRGPRESFNDSRPAGIHVVGVGRSADP